MPHKNTKTRGANPVPVRSVQRSDQHAGSADDLMGTLKGEIGELRVEMNELFRRLEPVCVMLPSQSSPGLVEEDMPRLLAEVALLIAAVRGARAELSAVSNGLVL